MKKGLLQVFVANIVFLLAGVLTNFILPRYLSVDSYSMVKTYALYISYAGFFHFGYSDGMYLKFGGRSIDNLNEKEVGRNFANFCVILLVVSILLTFVGIACNDFIVFIFALGVLPTNLIGYFKNLSQAIGEYKLYGNALNAEKVLTLLFDIVLVLVIGLDDFKLILITQVFSTFLVAVFLCVKVNKRTRLLEERRLSLSEIVSNIKLGFVLMLGNFSSALFTGLDRWFVKTLMTSYYFAQYSFAVSLEQIINVFITPITVSLYNYFCKHKNIEDIKKVKRYSLIWSFAVVALAFPMKWVVELAIPNYIDSINVIFLLFATHVCYTIIKGIYVNYYKSNSMQSLYFRQLLVMTAIAFLTNVIGFKLHKSMLSFAAATLLTAAIWLIVCECRTSVLRFETGEFITIFLVIVAYLICGFILTPWLGLCVYVLFTILVCRILMRNAFIEIIEQLMLLSKTIKNKLTSR